MPTSYANAAGLNPEDVYDPDIVGDGPTAAISGIGYRKADGTLLRFAALKYGSAAPNHGYRLADGRDFSALWAKKGTATYNLPINGNAYSAFQSGINGSAQLIFNMKSDGTYSIVRSIRGATSTVDSGTWLPAGDGVAQYTCYFTLTTISQSLTGDGGFNNSTTAPAPTQAALTTSRSATVDAHTFTTMGVNANQSISVACNYYRLGILVHTVTVTFNTQATS